jgi:hypothetical protein
MRHRVEKPLCTATSTIAVAGSSEPQTRFASSGVGDGPERIFARAPIVTSVRSMQYALVSVTACAGV